MNLEILKKYFWAAKLVFVALLASELAMLVNKRIDAKIGQVEVVGIQDVKLEKPKGYTSVTEFVPILKKNIFNSEYVYVDDALSGGKKTTADDYDLIGTIAWAEPYSMAIIRARVANKTDVFRVDDKLEDGARVAKIEARRVTIDRNGREEILELPEIQVAQHRMAVASSVSKADLGTEGVKQVGEGQYLVSQELFHEAFSNPAALMRGAAFVPFFEKGGIAGFKMKRVNKTSIYGKLGFEQGDILRQINGIELKGIDDIMSVMASLKDAKRFSLDMTRNGQRKSFSYDVH